MTNLDKILGELQLEVEELTADLERSASQEQTREYLFNKDRDSQESQYSIASTISTDSSGNSADSSGTSPDKQHHTDHPFDFSLALMQEELIQLNSSLNKRPTNTFTNPPSSQTQFNVSSSNGLQKSSPPRLAALQTIFSSTVSSPGQSTTSSPISASTTTTSSPISPNGDNNLFRNSNMGKNTDNTSPDALVPNIIALAGLSPTSPAESPPISSTSSPMLGARAVSALWNDSESEGESESDSDSSDDSETDSDSDDSGSSDFNPLSLSRKRLPKPVSDISGDATDTNKIRRSVTNGYKQSPPKRVSSPTPNSSNSSNLTPVTPTGAKIIRKGTTARGLGSRVRVKSAPQSTMPSTSQSPSTTRSSKDPLPPTPALPKAYVDSEKEPNRIRELEVDSRQSVPRGRVAENYTKGRSRSRDRTSTHDRDSSNQITRGRELESRDINKYQGQRRSAERRSIATENDPRQVSGRRLSPTRGRPRDRSDRQSPSEDTRESRSRSVNRDQGNRGRSRSRARNTSPKPSRPLNQSRSRTREDDRGRSNDRSYDRPSNAERSRSKSQTRVNGKSRTAGGEIADIDFEKERDKILERSKNGENKDKPVERSKTRREKKSEQADKEIKITTRIYIGDVRQFKTLALTSRMNALSVLKYLKRKQAVPDSDEWTLFELVNDLGLERPLRDWEIVTNVINTWDTSRTTNALVCKTYAYRHTLTVEGLNNGVPPLFGWLHLKLRKNKWEKRYIYLRDGAIYHAKDAKGVNETFLCTIAAFDVYTITKPLKRAPTKFAFALKSQDKITMFESPDQDYVHYLCAEHLDKMKDWVLSIRNAKAQLLLEERPELFRACMAKEDILSPTITSPQSDKPAGLTKGTSNEGFQTNGEGITTSAADQWATLRRAVRYQPGKSSRKFDFSDNAASTTPGVVDDSNKKLEANNGNFDASVFKPGSLLSYDEKNIPLKQVEQEEVSWAKGSLLASSDAMHEQKEKERREERKKERERAGNGTTLVHLDNGVHFNKGSLLDKARSDNGPSHNGTFLNIHEERTFSKGSLLAQKKRSVENLSPNRSRSERQPNGPLLSIDNPPSHHQSRAQSGFTTHSGNGPLLTLDLPSSQYRTPHNAISPTSPGSTLLQLNLKQDAQHTLALRGRDIKPLVSFVPGEKPEAREIKREQGKTLLMFNNEKEDYYDDNEYSSSGVESMDE